MQIVNLTPHPISVTSGPHAGSYPSAGIARVDGLPLGPVVGLPPITPGVRYVVSVLVAERLPHRHDLLVPGEQERDATGRIVGCKALASPQQASPALALLQQMLGSPAGRWAQAGLYMLGTRAEDADLYAEIPRHLAYDQIGSVRLVRYGVTWEGSAIGDPQQYGGGVFRFAGGLDEVREILGLLDIPARVYDVEGYTDMDASR